MSGQMIRITEKMGERPKIQALPGGEDLSNHIYAIDLRLRPASQAEADVYVYVGEVEVDAIAEYVTELAGRRYRLVELHPNRPASGVDEPAGTAEALPPAPPEDPVRRAARALLDSVKTYRSMGKFDARHTMHVVDGMALFQLEHAIGD
jgi:hypothetical protein